MCQAASVPLLYGKFGRRAQVAAGAGALALAAAAAVVVADLGAQQFAALADWVCTGPDAHAFAGGPHWVAARAAAVDVAFAATLLGWGRRPALQAGLS